MQCDCIDPSTGREITSTIKLGRYYRNHNVWGLRMRGVADIVPDEYIYVQADGHPTC